MAIKRPHKKFLVILGALALIVPSTANRNHLKTAQDTQEFSKHTVHIENPSSLQSTKKYAILRQIGLILAQNFVEANRLNSPSLVLAGLQALAQAFPLQVEFADSEKVPLFLASQSQVTLCKGFQPTPSQFCEATSRSTQKGLSAKNLGKEHLLRIDGRVFRISESAGGTLESAQSVNDIAKILREIELATGKSAGKIAHIFLNGLLVALDPHTNFLNAEEYKAIKDETHGQFGGVGIVLRGGTKLPIINEIVQGSSADKAGLLTGDIIIRVNDKPTIFMPVEQVANHLRIITAKNDATVWIYRPKTETAFAATLSREEFETSSVESADIPQKQNIIYARITSFSDKTAEELRALLIAKKAAEENKMLVLDLRGNPGGLLDEAVEISDLFLKPTNTIVAVRTRFETQKELASFREKFNLPMAILVDSGSASASEIVAGALRDHGRALIVGERTYGKGSVQSLFETGTDDALKLTVAHYFTPNGFSIQGQGIVPHITTRALARQNDAFWIAGTAEPERENDLPSRLENPSEIVSSLVDIDNEYESTVWTENTLNQFVVGVPQAPLSPRKTPNWQAPRTLGNDFSLRTAVSALEELRNGDVVPNPLPTNLIAKIQSAELSHMGELSRQMLAAAPGFQHWQIRDLHATPVLNEFQFELQTPKTGAPQSIPIMLHLNGRSDGPTLIVMAHTKNKLQNKQVMKFKIPEIAHSVRSLQEEQNPISVAARPSLDHPEIPMGNIAITDTKDTVLPEKPMITLHEETPCSQNKHQTCTPVSLTLPEHALTKNAHFAIVPFLSRNSISVPQGPISLTKNGLGFATFRFEVPIQNSADIDNKTMGVVGALLKDSAGGILRGWPIIAVRNGAVEKVPDTFEP